MTTEMSDEENKDSVAEQPAETETSPTPEITEGQTEVTETEAPAETEQQHSEESPTTDSGEVQAEAEGDGEATGEQAEANEEQQEAGDTAADAESPAVEGEGGEAPQPQGDGEAGEAEAEAEEQTQGEGDGEQSPEKEEHPQGDDERTPEADAEQPQGEEGEAQPSGEATEQDQAQGDEVQADGETPAGDEQGTETPKPAEHAAEDGEATEAAEGDQQEAAESKEAEEKPEGEDGEAMEAVAEADEGAEPKSPVPQSDTFAEGERPESPVAVGQKLSREGTPVSIQDDAGMTSPPMPGTPDRGSDREYDSEEEEEEEEEEEYEEEEPEFDREQLIERYHQALAQRQQFQEQNYQLQHKLAEYFRKKKSDDNRQDADKNVTDQEQRYLKYMANLDELRRQDAEERDIYKLQIEELKDKCQDKQTKVDDERVKFMEFKRQVGLGAVNSRSGKAIPPKDIEQYLGTENRKEAEVVNVRLENIKLKNKLRKKENALKSKEELAEGLHLIDFEQLKIENQTYNEKIEERNEELLKLRKKITTTVQVLTHLKEKLQFVQAENQVQQAKLRDVEELAAKKRDILSRTKQARDALRIDNTKLRQNCGLLGNEPLLRDFEERKDESEDLKQKLDHLKMTHAELTLNLNGVRRKIEQAKSGRQ